MKFISFCRNGVSSFGAVLSDSKEADSKETESKEAGGETQKTIVDLGARYPDYPDLRAVLRAGKLQELSALAADLPADFAQADIEYLPTIPNAEKIICIGVNYANRNAEYQDNSDLPEYPSVFMRTRESLVGHEQPLIDPPESDQLDYEGEIVLVVGKEGRRISQADAPVSYTHLTLPTILLV